MQVGLWWGLLSPHRGHLSRSPFSLAAPRRQQPVLGGNSYSTPHNRQTLPNMESAGQQIILEVSVVAYSELLDRSIFYVISLHIKLIFC